MPWLKQRSMWILLLLTLCAYGLRVGGAFSSIEYIQDTQIIRQSLSIAQGLTSGTDFASGLQNDFKYPLALPFYLLGVYGSAFVGLRLTGVVDSVAQFMTLLFTQRAQFHLLAVLALNLINVALVPIIYICQRRLIPAHSGWLAAGLVAFNLLLIQFGAQARPHIPLAAVSFVAVALLVIVVRRGGWGWSLAATVACALTLGILQNGVVIVLPLVLAWLMRAYNPQTQRWEWRLWLAPITLCQGVLFAVLALLFYPTAISEYGGVLAGVLSGGSSFSLGAGAHSFALSRFSLAHIPTFIEWTSSYQPLLVALLPLALAWFIWKFRAQKRFLLVVMPFPLLNLLVWALFDGGFPRITAVLTPFMIFGIAVLLEDIALGVAQRMRWHSAGVSGMLLGVILVPLAINATRLTWLIAQPDTRTLASNWIEANVPDDAGILTNFQAHELTPTLAALRAQQADYPQSLGTLYQWMLQTDYQPLNAPTYALVYGKLYDATTDAAIRALIAEKRIGWIVTESDNAAPDALTRYALAHGVVAYVACPVQPMRANAALPDDIFVQAWRYIWEHQHPGPVVSVVQLGDPPAVPNVLCQ